MKIEVNEDNRAFKESGRSARCLFEISLQNFSKLGQKNRTCVTRCSR